MSSVKLLEKVLVAVQETSKDVRELKQEMQVAKEDMQTVKDEMQVVKEDLHLVSEQQKEHGGLLRSLIYASEVHQAQIDNLGYTIAKIEGEVNGIKGDINAIAIITSKNWNEICQLKEAR